MVVMNHPLSQAWWHWLIISATRGLEQENNNFKVRLGNLVRSCLKIKRNNNDKKRGIGDTVI